MDTKNNKRLLDIHYKIKANFQKNWRIYIYTLCGVGLCWVDLWRGIGNGAQWALAVNCTGFCILPLIIFRLDWSIILPNKSKSLKWGRAFRLCFYLWLIFFMIFSYPAFKFFAPGTDYDAQIITAVINTGLYVAVAIRVFFFLFFERIEDDNGKFTPVITCSFFVWLAFIALAIASVNEALWPLWFLVMFGSFYLAPINGRDAEEVVLGLVNGIIIGFFWIQSRAFLYRPYDLSPRYRGHYTNENVNAMFYMTTYIAWLIKLTFFRIKKKSKLYMISFFMASSMWAFVFITGCRSVMFAIIGVALVYWYFESKTVGKRVITMFVSRMLIMVTCAIISFGPVYVCARYIPPLRHHPIWYGSEYCDERVMSWDPIDSPKYTNLEEVLQTGLGRLNPFH